MSQYTYIVAGIDGTNSKKWKNKDGTNSHVSRFRQDVVVREGDSSYFDGPSDTGLNLHEAQTKACDWILRRLRSVSPGLKKDELRNVRVCLIGHSRGGGTAIELAKDLTPYCRVHFLGLYDAVIMNRTYTDEVQNCDHIYHALRASVNPLVQAAVQATATIGFTNHRASDVKTALDLIKKQGGVLAVQSLITALDMVADRVLPNRSNSRSSFRTTGKTARGALSFTSQQFQTSHGGVGGDPGYFGLSLGGDPYCNVSQFLTWRLVPINYADGADPRPYDRLPNGIFRMVIKSLFMLNPMFLDRCRLAYSQSIAADQFIREGATKCGLSFAANSAYQPYGDDVRNSNLLMSMTELGIFTSQ